MTHLPPETGPSRRHEINRTAQGRRGATRIVQRALELGLFLALLLGFAAAPAAAEDPSRQEMQSLDEQVQEIKSDVLGIAAELSGLEERLLFPSNTQVAVFVSLEPDEGFRLDAVEIQIDGEPVARHIYSFKELEALEKGGVQRIYTGNVPTGDHQITVTVTGKSGGEEVTSSESFGFRKEVEPKLVEISLSGGGAGIQLAGS